MALIAMPIPSRDFDPTEVAVSWQMLRARGHMVRFATPNGGMATADQIMLDGLGLDPWGRLPVLRRLRIAGLILRANRDGRRAYEAMRQNDDFRSPLRWDDLKATEYDALILPGGHRARGMRPYLESPVLQSFVADVFAADKPVGAICHGVLLAARSRRADGRSVLYGRRTTALTRRQERTADRIARLGRWWDPGYYRTYDDARTDPPGYMSVEAEVRRALASEDDFVDVAPLGPHRFRQVAGLFRDSGQDERAAFVSTDGRYVSARLPGDAHVFAATLDQVIRSATDGLPA